MKLAPLGALIVVGIVATGLATPAHAGEMAGTARYQVTFIPSWNPQSHPLHYPLSHAKHGLLTPMIGATHNSGYAIFREGMKPTPGLERLSEMGKHDPLDKEIREAIAGGTAGSLIEADMGSPGPVHSPVAVEFEVGEQFSLVSLVGMIAPSPDWFYGVSGVELLQDGQWVPRVTVDAYAWDSGGDSGLTYMSEDSDLEPKAPTRFTDAESFVQGGKRIPVGTFVFKRVPGPKS